MDTKVQSWRKIYINMKIGIIHYGMGNLYSIERTLKHLGYENIVAVSRPEQLSICDKIILPGVGAFKQAMEKLLNTDLTEGIIDYANNLQRPLLGICLGMQLLMQSSTEGEFTRGLSLIQGDVEKFESDKIKIPHVGFNEVSYDSESILFSHFKLKNPDFYFTHSYRISSVKNAVIGTCFYGETFVASFEKDNIFGTQFHPELSQSNGLQLFQNFLSL